MEMYTWVEVAQLCGVSSTKARNIIRALNNMLIKKGTPKEATVAGKIGKKFFHEQLKI